MAGAAIYNIYWRSRARVRENDGRRDTSRAMVSKEGPGGGPREAIPGGVMGGRRACELTKRSQGAVEGGGASAPVVSVTSRALGPPGDRGAGRPCSRDRGSLGPNRCPWRAAKGHRPSRPVWTGIADVWELIIR